MTLRQPNLDRMLQFGLSGMVEALDEQRQFAGIEELGFDDCIAMLLEREVEHRDQKSYRAKLRQAQLRIRADIQDVDCGAGRGIARTMLAQLAAGDWIRNALSLIVAGPTGSGKHIWLARFPIRLAERSDPRSTAVFRNWSPRLYVPATAVHTTPDALPR